MKLSKQQLKQIIKEELGGVLNEMGPEFPGEELPQGAELDQALNPSMPSDIPAIQAQAQELYDSTQGLDPHANYGDSGMMHAIQQELFRLNKMIHDLQQEFQPDSGAGDLPR